MWFPSWLRNLIPGSAPIPYRSARRRTPPRRLASLRLQLEPLEDRTVPSGLGFSTFLGGSSLDQANAVAVDSAGNTYVTGWTTSKDFPTTPNALQPRLGVSGQNAFVTKFDPNGALVYSTYLGGKADAVGYSIAVDGAGDAYVMGMTSKTTFPTTVNAFQRTLGGSSDAFVVKLNPTGSALLFSTYLGGSGSEVQHAGGDGPDGGIAVDKAGNAYVTGWTTSSNFPTTAGALQTTYGGNQDAFVAKFSSTGSLVYSTYLGGSGGETGYGIAVDGSGSAYVTGYTVPAVAGTSDDFPTTPGAFQTTAITGAFVTKLNATGSALVYSTYLSGTSTTRATAIAVDAAGSAYVTGYAFGFPTTPGAFQPTGGGAFVAKLNPLGSALDYATYLDANGNCRGFGIAVDGSGNAYVTGWTSSSTFPTTPGAFQTAFGGQMDTFLTKLDPTGSQLVYSTYLGGSDYDQAYGVAVDAFGNVYLVGYTQSTNFPTKNAFQRQRASGGNGPDGFVTKIVL